MDVLSYRIEDFPEIKAETYAQKVKVESVLTKMEHVNAEVNKFQDASQNEFKDLQDKSIDLLVKLKELRQYINGLADELVLSSNQITVPATAGFGTKPMNLLEVLKQVNLNVKHLQTASSEHTTRIGENIIAIGKKADESVLVDVETVAGRVSTIEAYLKKDEEVGLSVRIRIMSVIIILYMSDLISCIYTL